MSDRLRAKLREQLAKKVDAKGVVVWDDPEREYVEVASSACPHDATFLTWEGSWYDVRHRAEHLLSGERAPRLVVYLPTPPPASDPLAELRDAGTKWTIRLLTLVKQAFAGQLSDTRIDDIGRKAATLLEAEAAAEGGDAADVRLIPVLGSADSIQMALAVLTGDRIGDVDRVGVWPEVLEMLSQVLGGTFAGQGDDLRRAVFRHLVLTELARAVGVLPGPLALGWTPTDKEQNRRATAVLSSWRRDRTRLSSYVNLARLVDDDLEVRRHLAWSPALAALDLTPAIESLALDEAIRLLAFGDFSDARALAEARLDHQEGSLWASGALLSVDDGTETWGARWRMVRAVAALRAAVAEQWPPGGRVVDQLRWYASEGWVADQQHRQLELARTELHLEGDLEPEIANARAAYEAWLGAVLERFSAAVDAEGVDGDGLLRQAQVHPRYVVGAEGLVAYLWVDALRYELGVDLGEALQQVCSTVEVTPALAAVPTITPVGMANLCPGADTGLTLDLSARNALNVRIGETEVKGVPERVGLLRAAHGEVVNLTLADVLGRGERDLQKRIAGASLVLVRSQEMDAVGETTGMLGVSWPAFTEVRDQLVRAVARLGQAGVQRVVICADHGFIALSRGLRTDRVIDSPKGGTGELHRRGWVGRGAAIDSTTIRVALADAGVRSDLDLVTPSGLAVFAGAGARHFFHGGLSPQELLVPVLVAELNGATPSQQLAVTVAVAGGKLTTGVFSARVTLEPTLFTATIDVRLAVTQGAAAVARVVAGDGFDPVGATVRLMAEQPNVLTFQVTNDLDAGATVDVSVLDARTDKHLASTTAAVAAAIRVDDDLG